jgi:hypothetical protein
MGSWVWCKMPIILALRRLKQEDCKFDTSLGYRERPCLKNQEQIQTGRNQENQSLAI